MSLLSLQRHPIHTIALGHLDTNMALLSLMIVPICMTITKEFKFQCGSIITFMGALTCKRHIPLDSNVVLLLPIHSQYSKNKHFSTPICRPAKITACFITLTFNHADNFYISRLYSAYCRPPGVFTL